MLKTTIRIEYCIFLGTLTDQIRMQIPFEFLWNFYLHPISVLNSTPSVLEVFTSSPKLNIDYLLLKPTEITQRYFLNPAIHKDTLCVTSRTDLWVEADYVVASATLDHNVSLSIRQLSNFC